MICKKFNWIFFSSRLRNLFRYLMCVFVGDGVGDGVGVGVGDGDGVGDGVGVGDGDGVGDGVGVIKRSIS